MEDYSIPKITPPTPHISAPEGSFAKTVLVPGDPKRAEYIAKHFLKDAKLVNDVRGIQGYTGTYNDVRISVQASGMGIPSMGIYSYELYNAYGVENIIRVGSAGSINLKMHVRDIVIATGASTNSSYGSNFRLPGTLSGIASYKLLRTCDDAVKKLGLEKKAIFGPVISTDSFYTEKGNSDLQYAKMGILAVEMECYGLYLNASRSGKEALTICTVSDDIARGEHLSAEERQTTFDEMIRLGLETACMLEQKDKP